MDVFALILSVALIGGALALILYPLWRQTRLESVFGRTSRAGQTLEEYEARYQAVLAAIRDLMFDREMGKVSAEDYEVLLTRLKFEAAGYRQQIDRLSRGLSEEIGPALNAEIEAMVDRMREQSLNGNEPMVREVEAELDLLKNMAFEEEASFACPQCGKEVQAEDAFCSRCGQPLEDLAGEEDDLDAETADDLCPECGYGFEPGDTFCVKCGAVLDEDAASQPYEEDARV